MSSATDDGDTEALVLLDHPEPLKRFNSPFYFHRKLQCFVHRDDKTTRLWGLWRSISWLFPGYSFKAVSNKAKQSEKKRSVFGLPTKLPLTLTVLSKSGIPSLMSKEAIKTGRDKAIQSKFTGRSIGRRVDRNCCALINNMPCRDKQLFAYSTESRYHYRQLLEDLGLESDIDTTRVHLMSWIVFEYLHRHGYRPVAAQIPAGNLDHHIATAADMIWKCTKTGKLLLIELKKQESNTYTLHTGMMAKPLETKTNSALHQHQIQLAVTKHLLEETYHIRFDLAWVLRVHTRGIQTYALESWAVEAVPEILLKCKMIYQRRPKARKRELSQTTKSSCRPKKKSK